MQQRQKKKQAMRRFAASLTAAVLAAASLPVCAVSSEPYNTWTGYVLRDPAGRSVFPAAQRARAYRSAFTRQTA